MAPPAFTPALLLNVLQTCLNLPGLSPDARPAWENLWHPLLSLVETKSLSYPENAGHRSVTERWCTSTRTGHHRLPRNGEECLEEAINTFERNDVLANNACLPAWSVHRGGAKSVHPHTNKVYSHYAAQRTTSTTLHLISVAQ
jgi:hypothetical protein